MTRYRDTEDSEPWGFHASLGDAPTWDPSVDAWLPTSHTACKESLRADDELFAMPERQDRSSSSCTGVAAA